MQKQIDALYRFGALALYPLTSSAKKFPIAQNNLFCKFYVLEY